MQLPFRHGIRALFALDDGALTALLAAAGTVAFAIGGGVAWLAKWIADKRKTTLDEWREIVARQDAHIAELQRAQDECRQREARQNRIILYLYGVAKNFAAALAGAGIKTEPLIDVKELLNDPTATEFDARTTTMGTVLLRTEAAAKGAASTPGGQP